MIIHSPHSDASEPASAMSEHVASTVLVCGRRYPRTRDAFALELLRQTTS